MNLLLRVVGLLLLCLAGSALAQPYAYNVYIDADLRTSTGCTVSGGGQTFEGADFRLTATVSGTPPVVTARALSSCINGNFTPGNPLTAGYPVGLNNGLGVAGGGLADVIELSVARLQLPGAEPQVRVGVGAASASGSLDVLYTVDGTVGAPAIILGTPQAIPTLGFFAALLLALGLSALALRALKRNRMLAQLLLVGALFSAGLAAWAANFIADGQVSDWNGVAPLATDPQGDPTPNLAATDIVAVFGADDQRNLHFRIDVVDAENRPPVANNDAYTTLEDTALTVPAPGVLGNDSDPDANPITAQLVTGPTQGTLTLNANGSFSYTPNANANGSDSFTYHAFDGQVTSQSPATVAITITPVNDVPVFTAGPNQTVLEDAGAQTVNPWATGISDGDPEATQNLTFNVTGNTNPALFSAGPAISATGALTYTPAANANGTATITLTLSDDGGTAGGGVDTSAPQSFTITVTAVNDAPSFAAGANQTVNEDAGAQTVAPWATAISPGPADESAQTVSFNITGNTNPALFSAAPAISPTGTLTYTPAANANGVATITLVAIDSGSGAAPNVNTSAPQTFTITVTAINDAPVFTKGPDQTVLEDAGAQTVNPWATGIDDGDPELTQTLSFIITGNTNAALFSAGPSVSPSGALSYTPAANANGSATITLRIEDNGSNTPPNVNTSATQSFTITVTAVNDAPSFTKGADQTVNEDAGPQTVNPWATAISPGPADEAAQTISFNVTGNSNAGLFSAAPAISPAGVLSYTPAANASGSATITLVAVDSGSGVAPNVNTSAAQTFVINVSAVNDAPVNTVPAVQQTGDSTPLVFSTANTNAISVADVDAAAGIVQMSFGTGAPANGTLTLANPGGVLSSLSGNGTAQVIATGTLAALNAALNEPSGSLTYTPVAGTAATRTITVITNDQGNTGSGGAQIDTDLVSVNVDAPPVVSSTPASGATIANNAAITVNFSEPVNVAAGITFSCTAGSLSGLGGTTGSGVTSLNLTYAGALGGTCTLTVPAASVTDVDTIDPPNNPAANFVATFTVDAAPSVTATTPANGAMAATTTPITVTFSEAADVSSAADFSLECPSGAPLGYTVTSPPILPASTTSVTIVPATALPEGVSCTFIVRGSIPDSDLIDPPNTIGADVITTFTTDAAPAFVSAIPVADGDVVGTGQAISFTFNENVANLGGAITLSCGGAVTGTISGGGTPTLTFTPTNPLTAGASCTATAVAAQIGDSDAFDPPQSPIANVVRNFTVDLAPTVTSTNPANNATGVPLAGVVTINFSENVNFAGGSFTYSCGTPVTFNLAGNGTNAATLTPTSLLPINTLCTVTALAAGISDVDTADPPNTMAANHVLSFTSVNDNPPAVSTTEVEIGNAFTPLPLGPGVGSDSNTQIRLTFSEPVNPTGVWAQLLCSISGSRTVGSGLAVTILDPVFVLTPSVNLTAGDSCTLTVFAAQVVDDDAIDPPDNMAANHVVAFNVDAAPSVSSVLPGNGASNLATSTTITVNFSEAVNIAAGGVTLNCGAPISFGAGLPATNVTTLTLTPSAPLPEGATCTGTVVATLVTDVDASDPPNQMLANFAWSFTTDAAPTVTAVTPAAAAVVPTSQTITANFSENVDLGATALTLNCGGPVAFTSVPALPANGTNTITLTPTGGLPQGSACTFTVVAAQVADSDLNDPPNNLAANFVRSFTVDAAPAVTTTVPVNGAANVSPASDITINFGEAVNFSGASFTLECPAASAFPFVVSGTGTTTATLNPTGNLPVNTVCVVTVLAAGIADADAVDPPDTMTANHVFSFTPVNTRPVLTAGATLNYAENQAATAIDATITVADAEQANLVSASVQITTNYQNGADELACPGACGGLTASFAPASGTLTLAGTASLATYQTVLRSVSYRSTSENPSSAPRTVTWIGNDGIDPSLPVTSTINVTASNDPPVLTAGGTLNFIEGDPAGAIGAVTVTDPDDTNLVSATVTVSANFQTGADVLACGACGGLTASYTAPTLTISGSASLATYQAALSSVTFQNTSDAPSSLARTISYVGNDGDNNSAAVTGTVNIAALNDAPVNSVPGAQVTNEDTNLVFSAGNGNLVSIADADVAAATLQVQLSVSNGTLNLSGTSGLSFTLGGGTGFSAITFTGTLVNVNAALAGMAYVPTANYFGPAQLSITSNDQGNTGTGGALSDSDVVAITVNPVNDPPVATADSFDTLGNTELRIDLAAGVTPNIAASTGSATGVRHNDSDPVESDPFAVTGIVGCGDVVAPFDCTLASGSLLSMNANGSFRFRPSPTLASGAPTNDSFSYTITDAPTVGTAASANGTVTIRAFDKVWYVQQGAAGNGRSDSPLGSFTGIALGDGTDSDAPGDYIYVRAAGSSLSSSIVLEANQHLLGEGVALTTDRDLNGVTGTITLVPAGTLPTVSSGATSTVQITNAIPVEIRGLALGSGSGNAINLSGAAAAYTGSSTLTIANNQFTGATGDGIAVNTSATSLLSLAITDNAWLTSGAHGSNAVDIVNNSAIADSLRLVFSRNTNLNATSTAVLINGGAVARTTVTGFAGNSVHGNSAAAGVLLSNATFDATAGGTIQQVDGDALAVGQAGNGVGSVAATFSNLQGNLRFDDLDLYGIGGLSVSGTGSGLTFGVADPGSGGSATIDAATDFGVSANAVALDLRLAALTTASSASANVSLTAVTGQFGAAAGSAIVKSGGAAAAFVVGNSNLTSNYAGSLTTTGGVPGVNLNNNTGSTLNFSGTLSIASGSNTAFNATGGGTVSVTGAANTLTASSGVALNVSATTIGAAGMTFRSVSSGAGANVGISLDDTGNLAGLTVTGTGSAGSGGTISGKTGADGSLTAGIGIFLRDTRSPSFSWMQLNDFENFAIRGFRVNGLTLSNSVVNSLASGTSRNGNSDVQNEGSVAFGEEPDVPALGSPAINGLTGAVTIANCVIEDGFENNFKISNTSGSLAPFSMTATTIRNTSTASPGNNGLEFRYSGNAGLDATITGSTFTANRSNAIQFSSLQSFTGSANLQVGAESTPGSGSTFSDNNIGVNIANGGTGSVNFGVHRGTFTTAGYAGTFGAGGASSQININMAAPSSPGLAGGPMSGSLTQNNINNANSTTGPGMRIVANGTDGDGSNVVTVRVVNNTISQVANRGIEVLTRDGNATINATIRGNSVQLTDPSAADAIFVVAGATSTAVGTGLPDSGTVNLDAADNDANTSVGFGIRVRQRFSSTYRLEQYAGLAADDAAVVAYLLARNPLSAGFSADHTAAGSAGFLTTASVPEP